MTVPTQHTSARPAEIQTHLSICIGGLPGLASDLKLRLQVERIAAYRDSGQSPVPSLKLTWAATLQRAACPAAVSLLPGMRRAVLHTLRPCSEIF
jgi:hypothetical protein